MDIQPQAFFPVQDGLQNKEEELKKSKLKDVFLCGSKTIRMSCFLFCFLGIFFFMFT